MPKSRGNWVIPNEVGTELGTKKSVQSYYKELPVARDFMHSLYAERSPLHTVVGNS